MLHIALSKPLDLPAIAADAAADIAPNHIFNNLAEKIPLTLHAPAANLTPTRGDKLRAKLFPPALLWAHARRMLDDIPPTDTIYVTGEGIALPLAVLARKRKSSPRILTFIHNLNRPRAKALLSLFHPLSAIDTFFTNTPLQRDFLRSLRIPDSRIVLLPEQVDTTFFRPALTPPTPVSTPVLASVGLEQRDYKTLAAATANLPVAVNISGFSKDARAIANAFPDPLPANMSRQFYDWPALRKLYHAAAVVIVPLFDNRYCAGLTAYLEAAACRKPIIITRTQGLAPVLPPDTAVTVPPHDPAALRQAIQSLLADPQRAAQLAASAYAHLCANHTPAHFLNTLLPQAASPTAPPPPTPA